MTVDELYQAAGEVVRRCNPAGVTEESAAGFIEQLQKHLRQIGGWLAPTVGMVGYADGQLIDLLRQLKFQSEIVIGNFPMGVENLSFKLEEFRLFLQSHYQITVD